MGSLLWILKATPKVTMKLLVGLALLVASASAFDLSKLRLAASPTADNVEYGFCEGSPEPASIDNISVEPFPILIQNGATVTLNVQITLNEPLPAGASVALDLVLEGIIPIKIPCLDINGISLGSCTYPGDELLAVAETAGICPQYFPEGQACLLPLLKGTINAEASFVLADGSLFACGFAKFAVD